MSIFASPIVLRRVLLLDAASCLACGALQLAAPAMLPPVTGLPAVLLLESGIILLLFGAGVVWLARHDPVPRRALGMLVTGNLGWALACVALMVGPWIHPTGWGHAYLALQAATVLVMAQLQWRALRHTRSATLVRA